MGEKKTEYRIKPYEKLAFTDDFMFGKVIQHHRDICRELIELVLGVRIKRINYIQTQKSMDAEPGSKSVRLDAYVDDEAGTFYEIEMQTGREKALPRRSRYYQSVMDVNLLMKGEYYDQLPKSYVIFLCRFDPFGYGRHIYSFENICLQDSRIKLRDDARKIFVSGTKKGLDDVSGEMKAFIEFLADGVPTDDFTKKIDSSVKAARNVEKWRAEYMTMEMKMMETYRKGERRGEKRGEKKGIAEGVRKNKQELRNKTSELLSKGYPPEEVLVALDLVPSVQTPSKTDS